MWVIFVQFRLDRHLAAVYRPPGTLQGDVRGDEGQGASWFAPCSSGKSGSLPNSWGGVGMTATMVHAITIALVAITLGLVFRVRQQLIATTEKLQREIDELKGKD